VFGRGSFSPFVPVLKQNFFVCIIQFFFCFFIFFLIRNDNFVPANNALNLLRELVPILHTDFCLNIGYIDCKKIAKKIFLKINFNKCEQFSQK